MSHFGSAPKPILAKQFATLIFFIVIIILVIIFVGRIKFS